MERKLVIIFEQQGAESIVAANERITKSAEDLRVAQLNSFVGLEKKQASVAAAAEDRARRTTTAYQNMSTAAQGFGTAQANSSGAASHATEASKTLGQTLKGVAAYTRDATTATESFTQATVKQAAAPTPGKEATEANKKQASSIDKLIAMASKLEGVGAAAVSASNARAAATKKASLAMENHVFVSKRVRKAHIGIMLAQKALVLLSKRTAAERIRYVATELQSVRVQKLVRNAILKVIKARAIAHVTQKKANTISAITNALAGKLAFATGILAKSVLKGNRTFKAFDSLLRVLSVTEESRLGRLIQLIKVTKYLATVTKGIMSIFAKYSTILSDVASAIGLTSVAANAAASSTDRHTASVKRNSASLLTQYNSAKRSTGAYYDLGKAAYSTADTGIGKAQALNNLRTEHADLVRQAGAQVQKYAPVAARANTRINGLIQERSKSLRLVNSLWTLLPENIKKVASEAAALGGASVLGAIGAGAGKAVAGALDVVGALEALVSTIGSVISTTGTMLVVLGGLSAAGLALGIVGEKANQAQKAFFLLGNSVEDLNALRVASAGLVSDGALQTAANTASAFQISVEDSAELMKVAIGASQMLGLKAEQAFKDIVSGVSRGSAQILDNLGIKLPKATKIYADEVRKLGLATVYTAEQTRKLDAMTKKQQETFKNATMKKDIEQLSEAQKKHAMASKITEIASKQLALANIAQGATLQKLQAQLVNVKDEMLMIFSKELVSNNTFAPIQDLLGSVVKLAKPLAGIMHAVVKTFGALAKGVLPIIMAFFKLLKPVFRLIDRLMEGLKPAFKAIPKLLKPVQQLLFGIFEAVAPLLKYVPKLFEVWLYHLQRMVPMLIAVIGLVMPIAEIWIKDYIEGQQAAANGIKAMVTPWEALALVILPIIEILQDVWRMVGMVVRVFLAFLSVTPGTMKIRLIFLGIFVAVKMVAMALTWVTDKLAILVNGFEEYTSFITGSLQEGAMGLVKDIFGESDTEKEERELRKKEHFAELAAREKARQKDLKASIAAGSARIRKQRALKAEKKAVEAAAAAKKELIRQTQRAVINNKYYSTSLKLVRDNLGRVVVSAEDTKAAIEALRKGMSFKPKLTWAEEFKVSTSVLAEALRIIDEDTSVTNATDMLEAFSVAIVGNTDTAEGAIGVMSTLGTALSNNIPIIKKSNDAMVKRNTHIKEGHKGYINSVSQLVELSKWERDRYRRITSENKALIENAVALGASREAAEEFYLTDGFITMGQNAAFMAGEIGVLEGTFATLQKVASDFSTSDLAKMFDQVLTATRKDAGKRTETEKKRDDERKARAKKRAEERKAQALASLALQREAMLSKMQKYDRMVNEAEFAHAAKLDTIGKKDKLGKVAAERLHFVEMQRVRREFADEADTTLQAMFEKQNLIAQNHAKVMEEAGAIAMSSYDKGMKDAETSRDEMFASLQPDDAEGRRAAMLVYLDDLKKIAIEEINRQEKLNLFDSIFAIEFDATGFAEQVRATQATLLEGMEMASMGSALIDIDTIMASSGLAVEAINAVGVAQNEMGEAQRRVAKGEIEQTEANGLKNAAVIKGAVGMVAAGKKVAMAFTKSKRKQAGIEAVFEGASSLAAFATGNLVGGAMHALAATQFAMIAGRAIPKQKSAEERDKAQIAGVVRTRSVQAESRTVNQYFLSALDKTPPGQIVADAINAEVQRGATSMISNNAMGDDIQPGF